MKKLLNLYLQTLHQHPLPTKCITTAVLFSLSDTITQKFIEKQKEFNLSRNVNLSLTGFLFISPLLHLWHCIISPAFLAKYVPQKLSIFKKSLIAMILHQIILSPIFFSGFFIVENIIKHRGIIGLEKGIKAWNQKFKETMMNNYKLWPAVTMINFMYIPMKYQVLFANFVGIFWNMYMSYIAYR